MPARLAAATEEFPFGLLATGFILTVVLLGWMATSIFGFQRVLARMQDELPRIMELRGTIIQLEEVLTMSARMAAATGDPQWEARYRQFEPVLDRTIKEARSVGGSRGVIMQLAIQTDEANAKLIAMEHEAFELVRLAKLTDAQALLSSPDYEAQKQMYAIGTAGFVDSLKKFVWDTIAEQRRKLATHLGVAALLACVLIVAWLHVLRAVHVWRAMLVEQARRLTQQAHELALANLTLDKRVEERTNQLEASRVAALNMMQDANEARSKAEQVNETLRREIIERQQLASQVLRLGQAVEQSANLVLITDPNGRIEYVNRKFTEVTGYSADEIKGQTPRILNSGMQPSALYKGLWEQIKSGHEWRGEFHNRTKRGELYWAASTISPIKQADGTISHFLSIQEDITSRKQAEMVLRKTQEQLVQAAKMESVGRLTSGIAHDFNNYLSVIHGFAELAKLRNKDDPKLAGQMDEILHASESGTALIQQLMAFSRQRRAEARVLSMTDGVSRMRALLTQLVGDQVRVDIRLPETSMLVKLDPTALEQMVMNLASNARDAMKREGTLTVRVDLTRADAAFRANRAWANADAYVRLCVRDTGPGMEPSVAERIFEPFYTTKQLGQGTGLGLAVVYGLVEQYDGHLEVDTAPGRGTAFYIYFAHQITGDLPQATVASTEQPVGTAVRQNGQKPRVLVVDDEPGSLQLCQEILQETCEVVTAGSGAEALRLLQGGAPDLLLTDIQMPEMDGVTLIQNARALYPDLKVAVMSAYMTEDREAQLRALPKRCEIIRKPLAITVLQDVVARGLRG